MRFCNDIDLTFYEFEQERNKDMLKYIIQEYRDALRNPLVAFYISKDRLCKKDIFPITKCFGGFKGNICKIKTVLSPLAAKE